MNEPLGGGGSDVSIVFYYLNQFIPDAVCAVEAS